MVGLRRKSNGARMVTNQIKWTESEKEREPKKKHTVQQQRQMHDSEFNTIFSINGIGFFVVVWFGFVLFQYKMCFVFSCFFFLSCTVFLSEKKKQSWTIMFRKNISTRPQNSSHEKLLIELDIFFFFLFPSSCSLFNFRCGYIADCLLLGLVYTRARCLIGFERITT